MVSCTAVILRQSSTPVGRFLVLCFVLCSLMKCLMNRSYVHRQEIPVQRCLWARCAQFTSLPSDGVYAFLTLLRLTGARCTISRRGLVTITVLTKSVDFRLWLCYTKSPQSLEWGPELALVPLECFFRYCSHAVFNGNSASSGRVSLPGLRLTLFFETEP